MALLREENPKLRHFVSVRNKIIYYLVLFTYMLSGYSDYLSLLLIVNSF